MRRGALEAAWRGSRAPDWPTPNNQPRLNAMKPADEERFAALVQWNKLHGGFLHPDVEIYSDERTGFSLRVKEAAASSGHCAPRSAPDPTINPPVATTPGPSLNSTRKPSPPPQAVKSGDAVVSCPLSTTLSYLNAVVGGRPLQHDGRPAPGHADDAAFPEAFVLPPRPGLALACLYRHAAAA
ncbi:hypothetical protein MAPG_05954 [Magnaporthiopsis poae ATCC 64411]|uniref:Uncharacterized protein n=1 Tax=Magnaporthiopsis poae (strain ATCC 64411 / 73-15) TaxID=644358 RepID=A0A0C4E0S0_MAGP6|nr:hypothetical protein MAPG_05954 [Magnaporthiopsis poae ATCC 64411]